MSNNQEHEKSFVELLGVFHRFADCFGLVTVSSLNKDTKQWAASY